MCDLETSRMRRPWLSLDRSATEIKSTNEINNSNTLVLIPLIISPDITVKPAGPYITNNKDSQNYMYFFCIICGVLA